MKKCKIEVLKTTFHEDLAKEYGCKNLGKCPMHKVGDGFYGDYAKPEAYVMKGGRLCINMYLHYLMDVIFSIIEIGSIKKVSQSALVMME